MTDSVDKSGAKGVEEHVSALSVCIPPVREYPATVSGRGLMTSLAKMLFPLSLYQYEGRRKEVSRLFGMAVSSYDRMAKPSGDAALTLPVISRARKIISRLIGALQIEDAKWRAKELELTAKRSAASRGMFDVRVRDATGIPRTGLARHGWRKNKSPPANF